MLKRLLRWVDTPSYNLTKDIILPLFIFIVGVYISFWLGSTQKQQATEISKLKIASSIIDLRIPGKWREAGNQLIQMYPHNKKDVVNSLFDSIISDDEIYGQIRNEPILWVLQMIQYNYGKPDFSNEQVQLLTSLKQSKEYTENENFKNYLDNLLELKE